MVGKLGTRASSEDDVAYDGQRLGNQTQALLDAGEALLERGARRCGEYWLDRHLHHGRHSSTSSRLLSAVACPNGRFVGGCTIHPTLRGRRATEVPGRERQGSDSTRRTWRQAQ